MQEFCPHSDEIDIEANIKKLTTIDLVHFLVINMIISMSRIYTAQKGVRVSGIYGSFWM